MNLAKIKSVVNNPTLSEDQQKELIIRILAEDKDVLPAMLSMLFVERQQQKQIISDLNLEVSRYNIHINDVSILKKNKDFLNKETKTLYEKWKDFISPLFNNKFA